MHEVITVQNVQSCACVSFACWRALAQARARCSRIVRVSIGRDVRGRPAGSFDARARYARSTAVALFVKATELVSRTRPKTKASEFARGLSSFKLLLLGGLLEMPLHVALVDAGCAVPIFELTATARRKHGNARGCGLDGDGCMSAVIAITRGNRDLPATVISPPTNIRRQTRIDLRGLDFW